MKLRTSLLTILVAERSLSLEPRANMLIAHYTNWVSGVLPYSTTHRTLEVALFVVPCGNWSSGKWRENADSLATTVALGNILSFSSLAWSFRSPTNISATLGG